MMTELMHLLQLSDSALPVGTFTFSNGIETASACGKVKDEATLECYLHTLLRQTAWSDGIAALQAFRATQRDDYSEVLLSDATLMACKPHAENRAMLLRMGRKLAELNQALCPTKMNERWLDDIRKAKTPGSYPVTQALICAENGLNEKRLFCLITYGTCSLMLNAALRQIRISHLATQNILWQAADTIESLYERIKTCTLDDIRSFAPMADIWASMHEKGAMRMFAN